MKRHSPGSNSLPVAVAEWLWQRELVRRLAAVLLLAVLLAYDALDRRVCGD